MIPRVEILTPDIPPALLECRARPQAIDPPYTQRTVAAWLNSLAAAHADCAANLATVRAIVNRAGEITAAAGETR